MHQVWRWGKTIMMKAGSDLLSAHVLANMREAVLITDANNTILSVNRAFTEITGYTPEEALGRNPSMLASGKHDQAFYQMLWQQLSLDGCWRGEIWDQRKNGEIYPKWAEIRAVHSRDGTLTYYVAIFSDISARKSAEEQLNFLVFYDPLTRLPNRSMLRVRFEQAVAVAERGRTLLAVLFLDIDQFKSINDSLGHVAGDQLLQGVAERLKNCVRGSDIVGRLGGDEFVAVLNGVSDANAVSQVAQKMLFHINEIFCVETYELTTSASIGIAMFPSDGEDFDTLLKKADTAMYGAKDDGRNTCRFFTEHMNTSTVERLQMRNGLRSGLLRNEFLLHYQPQFELGNGRLIGAEALIRWNRPEHGSVSPAQFIPVAESSGLIVPIGEWVLREACRQNRAWQDAGYSPIKVAVNLSALQFRRGNLVTTVRSILDETGLLPEWLELELTESILLEDVDHVLEVIEALKRNQLTLSIDDFGTGYSSLAYLKRFAVDKLKIDQSFVRNLAVDKQDAAIIRSIIELGRGLNLRTIAEGVETDAQRLLLQAYGCNEAQGYLLGKPVPAHEFNAYLHRNEFADKP